jgi:hypothetical protein
MEGIMKTMKFTTLSVFVVSLFLVLFCLSKPADGILKVETSFKGKISKDPEFRVEEKLKELQLRAAHVFGEIVGLLHYNFNHQTWDRMGLLLAEQGAVLYVDRGPISGKEDIAVFFRDHSRGRTLEIDSLEVGPFRMIEAVINGYEVNMLCSVEFKIHLKEQDGDKTIRNQTIPSNMFLFHRKVCWPDG